MPCIISFTKKQLLPVLFAGLIVINSKAQPKENILHNLNWLLVNTVMDDLFTPPVASRIYMYPPIAFYECIRHNDKTTTPLSGKLNGLKLLAPPPAGNDNFISACIAFSYVAQILVGSEYKIETWRNVFVDSLRNNQYDTATINNALAYGKKTADSIIAWTQKDNYLRSRAMIRYVISNAPGAWLPTPLDYAPGLEPHWNTIRPVILKSPSQFSPTKK